jgi:hypothetical protein
MKVRVCVPARGARGILGGTTMKHSKATAIRGLVVGGVVLAATAAPALGAATMIDPNFYDVTDGGGNIWTVDNAGGTSNGLPAGSFGGDCVKPAVPGLTLNDAETGNDGYSDAYDGGALIWINDKVFANPDDSMALTTDGGASTVTSDTVSYSGLDTTMSYTFLAGNTGLNGVARTLVTLTNPSAASIDAKVDFVTNFGSDDSTELFKDQTGDSAYTKDDRWIVTTDDPDYSDDPINTTVFFGPGDVAAKPTVATNTVFDCSDTDGAWDQFQISVPAGATRHFVFFNMITEPVEDVRVPDAEGLASPQATPPNNAVLPYLTQFDSVASASNPLFAGIPADQLPSIVNWAPAQVEPTPTTAAPTTTSTAPAAAAVATQPKFTG